ncbi:hypothetical protein NMY22_g19106 [Coprinellus aureogranulatus]|nr:hypothetical protein NMY22_g19106 [Coprinellus aureogranulatus]
MALGYRYSTLCLPSKQPSHEAPNPDLEDPDATCGNAIDSSSPLIPAQNVDASPTVYGSPPLTPDLIVGDSADRYTPATAVEALLQDKKLADCTEADNGQRDGSPADKHTPTQDDGVHASPLCEDIPDTEDEEGSSSVCDDWLWSISRLEEAQEEEESANGGEGTSELDGGHSLFEGCTHEALDASESDIPSAPHKLPPVSKKHATISKETSPLRGFSRFEDLKTFASDAEDVDPLSRDDEGEEWEERSITLSPLTDLDVLEAELDFERGKLASASTSGEDEVAQVIIDCLLFPSPFTAHLDDMSSVELSCSGDAKDDVSVERFFLWRNILRELIALIFPRLDSINSFNRYSSPYHTFASTPGPAKVQRLVYRAVHRWRDAVSREEDESTRYVLPNHFLFTLAENAPADMNALLGMFRGGAGVPPVVRKRAKGLLDVIREAVREGLAGPKEKEKEVVDAPVGGAEVDKAPALVEDVEMAVDAKEEPKEEAQAKDNGLWGTGKTPHDPYSGHVSHPVHFLAASTSLTTKTSSLLGPSSSKSSTIHPSASPNTLFTSTSTLFGTVLSSSSSLAGPSSKPADNPAFKALVSKINSTLVIAPSVPKILAEVKGKETEPEVEFDPALGMHIDSKPLAYVPAAERTTLMNTTTTTTVPGMEDMGPIVVVGRKTTSNRKKRKRDQALASQEGSKAASPRRDGDEGVNGDAEEQQEGAAMASTPSSTSKSKGKKKQKSTSPSPSTAPSNEVEDDDTPFDFTSAPNALDLGPPSKKPKKGAVEGKGKKGKEKTKGGAGYFYSSEFGAAPKQRSDFKGGNKSYTFRKASASYVDFRPPLPPRNSPIPTPESLHTMPKRRRIATDDGDEEMQNAGNSNEVSVTRSDIWLDDGNIVIQAEETQFKVHRGLLARVSPIFADVFSVPQPAHDDIKVEGCPLLHLQDSAQDITHLLSTLYDLRYHTKEPIPLEVAAALLRLGRKYEIKQLFQEIVGRLKTDLPTTLHDTDNLPDPNGWREITYESELLFKIAAFVYESDIPEIRCQASLPPTYFSQDDMIQGAEYVSDDGSTAVSTPLPPEVHRICLAGRQKLVDRFNVVFAWVDNLPVVGCTSYAQCSRVATALVKALWRPEPKTVRSIDTWSCLTTCLADLADHPAVLTQLCGRCSAMAKEEYESYREETWDQLPSYFGLPGWDVLNKGPEETD